MKGAGIALVAGVLMGALSAGAALHYYLFHEYKLVSL